MATQDCIILHCSKSVNKTLSNSILKRGGSKRAIRTFCLLICLGRFQGIEQKLPEAAASARPRGSPHAVYASWWQGAPDGSYCYHTSLDVNSKSWHFGLGGFVTKRAGDCYPWYGPMFGEEVGRASEADAEVWVASRLQSVKGLIVARSFSSLLPFGPSGPQAC